MKYLSGIYALNLPCELDTDGDWHASALDWDKIVLQESDLSVFGIYGIEEGKKIPEKESPFCVANHIRAALDLLEQGKYNTLQGLKDDFINNDKYTEELFNKIIMLKCKPNWNDIDFFILFEYRDEWIAFKNKHNILPLYPSTKLNDKYLKFLKKEIDVVPFINTLK